MGVELHPKPRTRRFTADDVQRMVDAGILAANEPVELIDGELVVVSPQGPAHIVLTTRLFKRLHDAYRAAGYTVRAQGPIAAGEDSLPEPDLAVVRGADDDYLARHPRGDETVLAVEVAVTTMPAAEAKRPVYARAGIASCWILDVAGQRLLVHTDPRTIAGQGEYARTIRLAPEDEVPLPGLDARLRVADLLP